MSSFIHPKETLAFLALLISYAGHGLAEMSLGTPPIAPTTIVGLPRADYRIQQAIPVFTVDPISREQARNFYNAVYTASENVAMNSTAVQSACYPGTNAPAFYEATLIRINWFRAMAGVPAVIQFDATFCVKDQQAALVMSANNTLSHAPPSWWSCWTQDAYDAAQKSNLALGSCGPEAITGYIWDFGAGNTAVGHRRWLLYPQTRLMGTGDVPTSGSYLAANATWVIDGHYFDPRPATRTPFVAWPPPGYVPYQVVFPRWSFAYPNADFSTATVTMKSNGVPISVTLETPEVGFGENTLVWIPMGLNANDYSTKFPFNGSDTVYEVTISGIKSAPFSTTNYTVTVFDPASPGADSVALTINGPTNPIVGTTNIYTVPQITNATKYQWRLALSTASNVFDGAELGFIQFTAITMGSYEVIQSDVKASGSYAFHLAHPVATNQILKLNYAVLAQTDTTLSFRSRLGWATTNQIARVQISVDEGRTWTNVYSQAGTGGQGETSFRSITIPLAPFAGRTINLQFSYDVGYGSYYPQTSPGVGWYIDNITITNAKSWLVSTNFITSTNATTFSPNDTSPVGIQARGLLFDQFPLEWGPVTVLTPVYPPPLIVLLPPTLSNAYANIKFHLLSGNPTTFILLETTNLLAGWWTNAQAILSTNNGVLSFTVPSTNPTKFYRILAK